MIRLEQNALVWGVVGNLGGGKTLTAVQMAVEAMRNGLYVVTNIALDVPSLLDEGIRADALYQQLSDLECVDWWKLPRGDPRGSGGNRRVLVILDEVAEWFDQYSSTSTAVKSFLSWLRHSSKQSQDVILVVQRQEYLAKSLRILVARWIWVDDLAVYRLPVLRVRIPFAGGYVAQRSFDRLGNLIQSVGFIRKGYYGRYYNTAQILANSHAESYIYIPPEPPEPRGPYYMLAITAAILYLIS